MEKIPAPQGEIDAPLQTQITLMDYNDFVGRIAICTVKRGVIKTGSMVTVMSRDGKNRTVRISKLFGFGQGFGIGVCAAMSLILCIVNMIKIFSPEVGTGSKKSVKSNGARRQTTRI